MILINYSNSLKDISLNKIKNNSIKIPSLAISIKNYSLKSKNLNNSNINKLINYLLNSKILISPGWPVVIIYRKISKILMILFRP